MPRSNVDHATAYRVLLDAAMGVTAQSGADALFAELVALVRENQPHLAMGLITSNLREALGYHAGYYGDEIRARVENLFRCAHPFFGPIAHVPPPVGMEAWELGRENVERVMIDLPIITLAEFRALREMGKL